MKTLIISLLLVSGAAFANNSIEKQKENDSRPNQPKLTFNGELAQKSIAWIAATDVLKNVGNISVQNKVDGYNSKKDENLPKVTGNDKINSGSGPILMLGNLDFIKKASSVKVCCLPCPQMTPCE